MCWVIRYTISVDWVYNNVLISRTLICVIYDTDMCNIEHRYVLVLNSNERDKLGTNLLILLLLLLLFTLNTWNVRFSDHQLERKAL